MKQLNCLWIALCHRASEPAEIVQHLNDAAAEIVDFGERVCFAAMVECLENVTELDRGLSRGHMPCADRVVARQLVGKSNASLP